VVAVLAVGAADLLAHRARHRAAHALARFAASAAALAIARAAGVSWPELGLGRAELGSGVRRGMTAGAAAAAAVFAAAAVPATRGWFLDERAAAPAGPAQLAAQLGRISFAAVPPEELIYRSALLGLRLGRGPQASAVAWSSALFGLSHVLPTLATMHQTALHPHLARGPLRRAAFVGGNVMVTGLAGAAFSWLRLNSGSVVAPALAHAALNDAALVAGRVVHRRGGGPAFRAAGRAS
jgi:membrane protease YdiL (CAAX protease family)